jgi:hypothetical protein
VGGEARGWSLLDDLSTSTKVAAGGVPKCVYGSLQTAKSIAIIAFRNLPLVWLRLSMCSL